MRNLFELKASNQDKLYPTMIKNILSKRTWNHYQGSPQVTCKDSRKTLAVCPKSLCLALPWLTFSLTTWEGLRGRTSKNKETTWRTSQFPGQTEGSEGFGGPEQETDIKQLTKRMIKKSTSLELFKNISCSLQCKALLMSRSCERQHQG